MVLHLSWTTSCAGCHLPIQANWKTEHQHYEGGETRNYASLTPRWRMTTCSSWASTARSRASKITPVRSSSALILSSTDVDREKIYIQQAPIAASGFSSQAFAPHYPHTERKTETKTCSDCHVNDDDQNNAIMAQLPAAGHQLCELRGLQRLGRHHETHREAVQVTGVGPRTPGSNQQLPAEYACPGLVPEPPDREGAVEDGATTAPPPAQMHTVVRASCLFVSEGAAHAGVRRGQHRQQGRVAPSSVRRSRGWGKTTRVASANADLCGPADQPLNHTRTQHRRADACDNQEQAFHPIYHYAFI